MLRASTGETGTSCRQHAPHPLRHEMHFPCCSTSRSLVSTMWFETICNSGKRSSILVGPIGTDTDIFSLQPPTVASRFTVAVSAVVDMGIRCRGVVHERSEMHGM